jgi:hypothetical protein
MSLAYDPVSLGFLGEKMITDLAVSLMVWTRSRLFLPGRHNPCSYNKKDDTKDRPHNR